MGVPCSLQLQNPKSKVYQTWTWVSYKETGTVYPSQAPGFTPGYYVVRVAHHFSFLSCFACLFVFYVFVPCFCVQSCMCLLFINSWLRIRVSLFSLFIYFIIKVELSLVRKLNDIPNCLPLFLEQLRKLRTKVNIRILQMLQ
jgi:hypothetical protein